MPLTFESLRMNLDSPPPLPLTHGQRSTSTLGLRHTRSYSSRLSSKSFAFSDEKTVSRKWLILAAVLFVLPWGQYIRTKSQWHSLKSEIDALQNSQKATTKLLKTKTDLLRAFKSKVDFFEQSNRQMALELRKNGNLMDTDAENYEELEEHENLLINRIDHLESHIQEKSRLAVMEAFGPEPYQVEIVVKNKLSNADRFVMEMAPLKAMPHSVHQFLRMVSEGVWDGISFVQKHTGPDLLHATPKKPDELVDSTSINEWLAKANLKPLSFAEMSSDYLCSRYSVAFTGTPHGPGFSIADSRGHKDAIGELSCFAQVVSGTDVVDDMFKRQSFIGGSRILEIGTVRLLPLEQQVTVVKA